MIVDARIQGHSNHFLLCVPPRRPKLEHLEPRWMLSAAIAGDILPLGGPGAGSIAGVIYHDLDSSGSHDAEPGLGNWAVQLLNGQGEVIHTARSDTIQVGQYAFTGLAAGTYQLRQVTPSTWAQTEPAAGLHQVTLADGEDHQDVNFGNVRYCTISGQKFNDLNGDTEFGLDEPALNGWTIELYDDDGDLLETAETAGDGQYMFADVLPGTYELREVGQIGWFQTAPQPADRWVTLGSGQDVTVDFGNVLFGTLDDDDARISGKIFEDTDGSGTAHEPGEPTLEGWSAQLRDAEGTLLDATPTLAGGAYTFDNLPAGTYRVTQIVPTTWAQIYPVPTTWQITLAEGEHRQDVDFGNAQFATITGQKFNDADRDGVPGEGEGGLNGWTIKLYHGGEGPLATDLTETVGEDDGVYTFTDVLPGTYELREVLQAGWHQTAPTPPDQWITVTSGQNADGPDFGNRRLADAVDDHATVIDPDNATVIDVLANDQFLLSPVPTGLITAVTDGAHGTTTIVDNGRAVAYTPANPFGDDDSFTYTVTDNGSTDTATVNLDVVNTDPSDQQAHHAQDELVLDLAQSSVAGDTITYTATVSAPDAYVRRLQQQLNLTVYLWPWDGWHGHQEKWLQDDAGNWFYMLPDGGLYRGGTNALLGMLGTMYYENPDWIIDGLPGGTVEPEVTATLNSPLTLDWPDGFVGVVTVDLTATLVSPIAVSAQVATPFDLVVDNTIPQPDVPDQDVSHVDDTFDLPPLPLVGPDGEPQTYTATVASAEQAAFDIKQALGLTEYLPLYTNYRGIGEKWLRDGAGGWYYIMPDGGVYDPATGMPVGRTSQAYYDDPQMLIDAVAPAAPVATVTVVGNQVTVDPAAMYVGWFQVELHAQDGSGWSASTVQVNVTNALPDMSFLTDRQMTQGDVLQIALPQTDTDGQAMTYQARPWDDAHTAFQLKQTHGLVGHYAPWDDHFGQGAKWLWDNAGQWYYLMPDGTLYRDGSGQALGHVAQAYYDDPATLVNAPAVQLPNVNVAVVNGVLTITPNPGFVGTFGVEVQGGDGVGLTDWAAFQVTVVAPQ